MKNLLIKFVAGFLALQMVIFSPVSLFADELTVLHGSENNWENFNVGAGQSTTITVVDEHGAAMVDGRAIIHVLQDYASQIYGNLDINGIIAILNANGFDIGADANVNVVGGLILSTLGISEQDFFSGMAALNQASNDPGFIHNAGHINVDPGSFLALIAGAIKNTGTIASEGGTAILAAGKEGYLSIGGDGLVNVQITKEVDAEVYDFQGNKIADQIDNSGTITANGGFVKLTAKGAEEVFDNIINHSGMIEAKSVSEKNGKIILEGGDEGIVRVSGTLDVSGKDGNEKGGTVHVLGDKVGLFDGANIDASGNAGGGTVLVGGDYKGENPDIQNASATYVGQDVSINASAILNGNGGKIIVWGTESSRAYGSLLATGGTISGDGGFIETSAHYLDTAGIRVSTAATNGHAGLWLLDPYDLMISSGADNNVAGTTPFTPTGASSVLNATTLQNALNSGDVTIQTGGDVGAGNGDITVNADLVVNNTLTLTAYGSVILNNNISGGSDLVVVSQHGNITQSSGNLTSEAGTGFVATEGDVSLTSSGNDLVRGDFEGINVTVTDTNGIEISSGAVTTNFSLTTTGAVTQDSYITAGGTTTIAAGSGNNITLNNVENNFGTVTITSGNNVTLLDSDAIALGASTTAGSLSVTGSTITLNGNIQTDSSLTLTGDVVLGASVTLDTENGGNNAGGTLAITGAVSGNAAGRDLTISTVGSSGGAVSLNTFTNDGGNYVNDVSISNSAAALTLNGSISLDDDGAGDASSFALTGGGVVVSNTLTIDTEQGNTNGVAGGAVDLGSGNISADANGYTFTINTANSDAGETGGAVTFGTVTNTAGSYFTTGGGFIVNSDSATDGVITVGGNVTTDGGAVSLTGDVRLGASRNFDTEVGGGNASGHLTFGGTLSATAGDVDLSAALQASGGLAGGNLTFDTVNNAGGFYLNDINMDLDGIVGGAALTLNGNVSLDNNGADAASFNLAGNGRVVISDTLTIDTEQGNSDGTTGGAIDFYLTTISADAAGYSLTMNTGNSDAGETGGSMVFGNVTNTAGFYLTGLTLNSDAATDGVISAPHISIDSGTLSITGTLAANNRTFDTEQGNNGAGGDVVFSGLVSAIGASRGIVINTSTTNAASNAGNVTLSTFNNTSGANPDSLTITATGGAGGSGGTITQNGALAITGTTTLAVGSGTDISLTDASNDFGTMTISSGNNVSVVDANTLTLGASTVSGDLSVTTGAGGNVNGALTQSGALEVGGTASFTNSSTSATAEHKNITLNNAANDFDTVTAAAGNNITLTDADDLTLGAITADGALTVTTAERLLLTGDITADTLSMTATGTTSGSGYIQQTAGAVTANTSSFEAYGARVVSNPPYPDAYLGIDLLENYDSSSSFGSLSMISHYSGASAQANGIGNTTVSGATDGGLFNVQIKNGNLTAGADDINSGSGNISLSINGTGNVAVNGDLTSTGNININANGGTITQQAGTAIGGTVSMSNASTATLNNTGSLELGEINVTNLSVTASENITQNNAITTNGTVTLTAGGDFNQSADGSIVTGSGSTWGDVTIHAGTEGEGTGAVTLAGSIEGNILVIDTDAASTGDITQSGSLISHDTGTTGIAITNNGTGDIVQTSTGTMALTFADAPVTDIGIALTALHGNIAQAGSVDAKQSLVTLSAEEGDTITQDDGAGHFGSITAGRTHLAGQSGETATLTGSNSLGVLSGEALGDLTVNDVNLSGLILDTIALDGNLAITAQSLSQDESGDGIVMGGSGKSANFIVATGAAIMLDNEGNDFGGNTVNVAGADNTSAGAVTIVDDNTSSLVLGTVSSSGTTTITAKSITLSDDFNAGTSTVNLTATDTSITTGNNAIFFSDGTLTSGDLNLTTASGRIYEDLGLIHSSGTMTIDASDGNNDGGNVVEFSSNLANLFGTVNITDAGDVVLYARDGYIISGISSTGDIAAKANYGFDDDTTGFLEVSGAITTSKTGGTILLSNARTTAEYGVIVNESGSLSASGNITLSAGSSEDGLTGNGISVAGSIHSDDGNIYIYNNRNYDVAPDTHYASNMNISGSISTDTGSVYLEDFGAGTITIADGANLDGGSNSDLTIQSDNGSINQTGGTISGDTGINLIAAGAVNINSAGNITNGGVPIHITAGADSSLVAGGYIATLAVPLNVDIAGILSVTAGGQLAGNSAVMIGNATNVIVAGTPPGLILFNGTDITPKPVIATTTNEAVSQTFVSQEINNAMPPTVNSGSSLLASLLTQQINSLTGNALSLISQLVDTSALDGQRMNAVNSLTSSNSATAATATGTAVSNSVNARVNSSTQIDQAIFG